MQSWDLGDGFALHQVDHALFARYHALYRPDPWMRDVSQRMQQFCEGIPCRFLTRNGQVMAGCLAGDGMLGEFFLVPPAADRPALLRRVAGHVRRESGGRVWAYNVLASEVDDYHRLGFHLASRIAHLEDVDSMDYSYQFSRMMVRPVQPMAEVACSAELRSPVPEDAERIGTLLRAAYGHNDPARSEKGDFISDTRELLEGMDDACLAASTIAHMGEQPVGACLISRWEGAPLLYDIAVEPSARHGGIAKAMAARAMSALDRAGETHLRLFLECGNPAETLYHSMGFIALEATTSMYME